MDFWPRILHRGRCSTVLLADGASAACCDSASEDAAIDVGVPGAAAASPQQYCAAAPHSSGAASSDGSSAAAPRMVVIKVYHKAAMQRRHHLNVAREISLLSRLRALRVPGVVRLLGTSECAANLYLRFAACEGGDLYARVRDGSCRARGEAAMCQEVSECQWGGVGWGGDVCKKRAARSFDRTSSDSPLINLYSLYLQSRLLLTTPAAVPQIIAPLLHVLVDLHSLNIVHRDIKPENIFFDAHNHLLLGDFGLAINLSHDWAVSRVGTLEYMAPEVGLACARLVRLG